MINMIRAAALFLATCAPAHAATFCEYSKGGTSVAILAHDTAAAQVVVINRLAPRGKQRCALTLDGLAVSVDYAAGPGDDPDVFITTPPDGYFAAPDWVVVPDGQSVTVLIWPIDEVGM